MTRNSRIMLTVVAVFTIVAFIYATVLNRGSLQYSADDQTDTSSTPDPITQAVVPAISNDDTKAKTQDIITEEVLDIELPEGVNPVFHDKTEIQVGWMNRGKDILLKNTPSADRAEFRDTYFHRGFKGRAITCGEVRFFKDGDVINEWQRFIFSGGYRTRLENEIVNFDILWQKKCVETLDEYFEYQDSMSPDTTEEPGVE